MSKPLKISALVTAGLCALLGFLSIFNGDAFGWIAIVVAGFFAYVASRQ